MWGQRPSRRSSRARVRHAEADLVTPRAPFTIDAVFIAHRRICGPPIAHWPAFPFPPIRGVAAMLMKRIVPLMLFAMLAATAASAQQTSGGITGRVLDAQKAAIPGATVTAKNAAT